MRICLVGDFDANPDEAMIKSSQYLSSYLSNNGHDILKLNPRKILSLSFWRDLRSFKPDIIHYITGSSLISFSILKLISIFSGANSIISIMRPNFSVLSKNMLYFLKPNLVIVQSSEIEDFFRGFKFETIFLPVVGIDLDKFHPNLIKYKDSLREKFKIRKDKFIVLHVGSIKEGRNLKWLFNLQKIEDIQVLVVGAVSQGVQKDIYEKLVKSNCIILDRYFEKIEELYGLSDCYVFPVVHNKNFIGTSKADCIDMPLSVFEAMSCNLPVVSTRFGGLTRIFNEGNGLIFVNNESELIDSVKNVKNTLFDTKTREKVVLYSWDNIVRALENEYRKIKKS